VFQIGHWEFSRLAGSRKAGRDIGYCVPTWLLEIQIWLFRREFIRVIK
jgi:hypothetical protein